VETASAAAALHVHGVFQVIKRVMTYISVISAIKLQGSIIHVLFDYGHDNSNND
jgi:hypothetical protein